MPPVVLGPTIETPESEILALSMGKPSSDIGLLSSILPKVCRSKTSPSVRSVTSSPPYGFLSDRRGATTYPVAIKSSFKDSRDRQPVDPALA